MENDYVKKKRQNSNFKLTILFVISSIFIISFLLNDNAYATTIIHNYDNSTTISWGNNIWTELFGSLGAPGNITSVSLNVSGVAGTVRAKIFADDGQYFTHDYKNLNTGGWDTNSHAELFTNLPTGSTIRAMVINGTNPSVQHITASFYQADGGYKLAYNDNGDNNGTSSGFDGFVRVNQFILPAGDDIVQVGLNCVSNCVGHNVRMKIYTDNSNVPNTLLAETGSTALSSGFQWITIHTQIPSNGKVWIGFEPDFTNTSFKYRNHVTTECKVAHVYGAGPNPYGSCTNDGLMPFIALKYSEAASGYPGTFISKSSSTLGNGQLQSIPVDATVPTNGKIWAVLQTDGSAFTLNYTNGLPLGTVLTGNNTYGSSNNFGNATQQTLGPWMRLLTDKGVNGIPLTLLGESGAITVNSTGIQTFPVTATLPSSSNVYAGFEASDNLLNLTINNKLSYGSSNSITHTYGTGPNPNTNLVVNKTFAPWMALTFSGSGVSPSIFLTHNSGKVGDLVIVEGFGLGDSNVISLSFNGTPVSTFPNPVTTDSSGHFDSVTFIVPDVPNGSYIVHATNGLGRSADASFTVGNSTNTLYVNDLHYNSLTNTSINLVWSTPSMGGLTFDGYQINYTTPFGTPQTIIINNSHSPVTNFLLSGLTADTDYSFRIGTVISNGTVYATFSNILNATTLQNITPPSVTPGNITLNYGTNPLKQPFNFYRQNINSTAIDLFVSYPNTYNTTCNFNYEFANTNQSYYNLATTANGTNRVKATFLFMNLGNEIVNTVCRDVITNDTGRYTITNSIDNIPLVQQIHNFENGVFGTQGQFGAFDLVELCVIIISMVALNRFSEPVGAIIMVIVIAALAFFHIGSFYVTIFSAIAMVLLLVVATSKKLAYTP